VALGHVSDFIEACQRPFANVLSGPWPMCLILWGRILVLKASKAPNTPNKTTEKPKPYQNIGFDLP
jgi:hypothetical protein